MKNHLDCDRRAFLAGGFGASIALAANGLHTFGLYAFDRDSSERAKLPAQMKLSLAAYSFNKSLPRTWYARGNEKADAPMSLYDVMDFAAATGFDAVELTAYYFPKPLDSATCAKIKNYAFRLGLDISGTAIGNDFGLPDGPENDAELEMARQWIHFSELIDAPVIRIFAGKNPKGANLEETIARCAERIRSLLPVAEAAGVVLALENHGGITAEPADMLNLIEKVGESPAFGVNFDGGNFAIEDPYAGLEKIAPYARNAQLKVSIRREQNGPKEPADLERTIAILRDAGYRGYVALEFEEENPETEIPPLAKEIRRLISEANGR